jgi:hypothetical protein
MDAHLTHVAERQRPGRGARVHSIIRIWFPYRRWLLLVILNLSSTIAVRTVLTIIYPATAVATWTNLHWRSFMLSHVVHRQINPAPPWHEHVAEQPDLIEQHFSGVRPRRLGPAALVARRGGGALA